jgi:hypothetical protein
VKQHINKTTLINTYPAIIRFASMLALLVPFRTAPGSSTEGTAVGSGELLGVLNKVGTPVEGFALGFADGNGVGVAELGDVLGADVVGFTVGAALGMLVGRMVGSAEGGAVGSHVSPALEGDDVTGWRVGLDVEGRGDGELLGVFVDGAALGALDGADVGLALGGAVGSRDGLGSEGENVGD